MDDPKPSWRRRRAVGIRRALAPARRGPPSGVGTTPGAGVCRARSDVALPWNPRGGDLDRNEVDHSHSLPWTRPAEGADPDVRDRSATTPAPCRFDVDRAVVPERRIEEVSEAICEPDGAPPAYVQSLPFDHSCTVQTEQRSIRGRTGRPRRWSPCGRRRRGAAAGPRSVDQDEQRDRSEAQRPD